MSIVCDLHIHSKYSRATSKNMDLPTIAEFAAIKGIDVVATADFVHPGWLMEIKNNLEELDSGLLKLKKSNISTEFILSTEISSIYKKGDKVRKIHNLILFPSLRDAEFFSKKLDKIGNIRSDGRPILGLDSKTLLEIALNINENIIFIPAHIWTPWFSLFGDKSGFDDIEECFEDLTDNIFALETGLSSDPTMNWRWSALDRFTLVSNSDAHSPANLGREANLLSSDRDFFSIKNALQDKNRVKTLEFYPEEGKYHYDGHRKCGVRLTPDEAIALKNICPVCGKKVTMGVYHRIVELADRRKVDFRLQNFECLVPLAEIISQIVGVGVKSKKVEKIYNGLIRALGSEILILTSATIDSIVRIGGEALGAAIKNMRENKIIVEPGYDGEYGKIILLSEDEKNFYSMKNGLFGGLSVSDNRKKRKRKEFGLNNKVNSYKKDKTEPIVDKRQQEAVSEKSKITVVQAGPGTGKTYTLVTKVNYLLNNSVKPEKICVITFTNKACDELKERINLEDVKIVTFHKLAIDILKECKIDFEIISPEEQEKFLNSINSGIKNLDCKISLFKKNRFESMPCKWDFISDEFMEIFKKYDNFLQKNNLFDFDDLLLKCVDLIKNTKWKFPYEYLLVDEFQDIDLLQFKLLETVLPSLTQLFVIGDKRQSIYGFRGGSNLFFQRISELECECREIGLEKNYRSCQNIIDIAAQVLGHNANFKAVRKCKGKIEFLKFDSAVSEAEFIVKKIKDYIGGLDFLSSNSVNPELGFKDFAILYRVHFISKHIEEALEKEGIPFQKSKDVVYSELDEVDLKAEQVKLLSFHAAKGLDFKTVFVVGVENGIVPLSGDIDEERRLLYVAMTRAKDNLFVTSCKNRFLYGAYYNEISEFLQDFTFRNIKKANRRLKGIFF